MAWAGQQYREPADLGLSPVQMASKESRLILNPFNIMGNPDCFYQEKQGTCYGEVECLALAGRYGNFCSGLTGLCCLFYRSCGQRTSQKVAYFRNLQYPLSGRATESCTMDIIKRSQDYCGVKVNMQEANFPKPSRIGSCDEASFMVRGIHHSKIEPKCGDLTGHLYTYDISSVDQVTIDITSSSTMRSGISWNMKVEQIPCSKFTGESLTGESSDGSGNTGGDSDGSGTTGGDGGITGSTGDGSSGAATGGPTGPAIPPVVLPPAPPLTTGVDVKPPAARAICGKRGKSHYSTRRNREDGSRRLGILGPLGPEMVEISARRKGGYPRPGTTFRRPDISPHGSDTLKRRRGSLNRRPGGGNRRNRPSNKKNDAKRGSQVQVPMVRPADYGSIAVETDEWIGPDLTDSLFYEYIGQRGFFSNRITYGRLAGINEFPWQVAMTVNGRFHCGGAIIGENWIITAAHCVIAYRYNPYALELSLGDWDLNATNDGPNLKTTAENITVHPRYSRATLQNDLAILRLGTKIDYTETIQPICIPDVDQGMAGNQAVVSGWGRNENQTLVSQLHFLEAQIVTNVHCDKKWNENGAARGFIVPSMMCMDSTSGDTCNGDSGGPSVVEDPPGSGRYVLAGLVSFGSGSCVDPSLPGVYTRVGYFRNWILENMV